MTEQFKDEKAKASAWFRSLRDDIVAAFEALEDTPNRRALRRFACGSV